LSRINAKRIVWRQLLDLNREHALGGLPNETELYIRFPNGSQIYLSGAKDAGEVEKFRGLSLKTVVVDEAQSFRPYLKTLIDDVLVPCLWDVQGELVLIGTPGPVSFGTFWEAFSGKTWSAHHWTIHDNPHIERLSGKTPEEILAEERKRRGINETDPTYQRESLGRWVNDLTSLVFHYDGARNGSVVDTRPERYVLGVDVGHDDADAIAVLGWGGTSPNLYLVEEHVEAKAGVSALTSAIERLYRKYDPERVVMDFGGLGKKMSVDIRERFGIPVVAAEKTEKFAHIELLNDALRTGKLHAAPDSRFAQDCLLVQWDMDARAKGKMAVSGAYHSDICFVAGTMIATETGPRAVEQVRVGDLVWTRRGLREVARATANGTREVATAHFSDGRSLTGTPDHRVWTENRGWTPLAALTDADVYVSINPCTPVCSKAVAGANMRSAIARATMRSNGPDGQCHRCNRVAYSEKPRRLNGTEAFGGDGQAEQGLTTVITSPGPANTYTGQYGNVHMGLSRLDTTSIITTATRATMRSTTWNAFEAPSMSVSTKEPHYQGTGPQGAPHWQRPGQLPQYGTVPRLALNGTACTQGELPNPSLISPPCASCVGEGSLPSTETGRFAVARVTPAGFAPVYVLSVVDCHEYFASGILVKNCDAVLYAYRAASHYLYEAPVDKRRPSAQDEVDLWESRELEKIERASTQDWTDGDAERLGFE
ncbi:MAG: Hint domain-containing protein, partial [bacterium]|nr:Hint domain-containing protein [bacterium]